MILVIDWNDTIQDEIGYVIEKVFRLFGVQLTRKHFYKFSPPLGKYLRISEDEFSQLAWLSEDVQVEALPFPGVKETFEILKELGHTIVIATTSWMSISKIVAWFDRHQIPFDTIIKTKDKTQVYGDYYFDDSEPTLLKYLENGLSCFKRNLEYNKNVNCIGFSHWQFISDFFTGLAEEI